MAQRDKTLYRCNGCGSVSYRAKDAIECCDMSYTTEKERKHLKNERKKDRYE